MKRIKRILLALSVFAAGLSVTPAVMAMTPEKQEQIRSDDRSSRKETRKQKRQERMEEWLNDMETFRQNGREDGLVALADSLSGVQALEAVMKHGFVLEADNVTFRRGTRVMVNSGTNFISLNGDRAVVQVSPSNFHAGPNGMGGVTVQGRAADVKVDRTRKGETVISMNVVGIGINAQVEIRLPEGSNRAYATVSPNFNSNTVRLDGRLVPFEMSDSVEGMAL